MSSPAFRLRTTDEPPATADLVVVGAGIVGCATAYFATLAGLRTVVLEARPRPATLTTPAATGAFRLQFDNPEEVALVREGLELYDAFAERTGLPGYDLDLVHRGYVFCALEEATLPRQRAMVEMQRGFGLDDVELLSGDDARRRFPFLAPGVLQVRFRAGDGTLDQVKLAWGYALAASGGPGVDRPIGGTTATFCFGERVTGIQAVGGRVVAVATAHASIATPRVVLATGPFLAATAALAGASIDIRPTRRQKVVLPDVPEVPPDGPMTIDEETAAHWRPALRGALALCTEREAPSAEPAWNVSTGADFAFRLLDPGSPQSLARVAPFWADVWERGVRWFLQAGQYEYTPDHRPYIGRIGDRGPDGLFVNGGYSGHGVMCSAGGARLLLDLILDQATGPNWGLRAAQDPFRTDRIMAEHEVDVL